jgi:RecA/RadA recombinase
MAEKRKSGILLSEKDLKRRYPDSGLASEICFDEPHSLRLPSQNLAINFHMGGGIPYGKILELAGEESSGKTLLAMDFAKVCISLGGIVLWDDAEATFDGIWARKHGVDLSRVDLLPNENEFEIVSDWVADKCVYWRSKLTHNEPILFVLDSVALMETGDAMQVAEQDAKAEMGRRSFNMGKFLRKRNKIFAKYGICVIFINQLRVKVGASQYEEKETTPLQQALKFYASQRVWLFRGKRLRMGGKPKGPWVGNIVYIRTKKNKTSIPRDNIQAEVYFRPDGDKFGYHKYHGFDELVVDRGIIKRKMGRFYYKDKLLIAGEDKFKALIANDDKLRAKLIKRMGINTISKTRQQITDIKVNLYPVKSKKKKDEENPDE